MGPPHKEFTVGVCFGLLVLPFSVLSCILGKFCWFSCLNYTLKLGLGLCFIW